MASIKIHCNCNSTYEGEGYITDNYKKIPHGKGIFTINNEKIDVNAINGSIYTIDGKQIISYKGGICISEFKDGVQHGKAIIYLFGQKYENAEFDNGTFICDAYYNTINTPEYIGELKNGIRHGYGKTPEYEGRFIDGKYEGYGKTKEYQGQFMDGKYHGRGVLNGVSGTWINGLECGRFKTEHGTINYQRGVKINELYAIGNEYLRINYDQGKMTDQGKMKNYIIVTEDYVENRTIGSDTAQRIFDSKIKDCTYEKPFEAFEFSVETFESLKNIKPIKIE